MTPSAPEPEKPNGTTPEIAADAIGVARVAGTAIWRVVTSVTKRGVDAANEVVSEVRAGEPITNIIDHQVDQVRHAAQQALGLDNGLVPRMISGGGPSPRSTGEQDLRSIGEAMLRSSYKVANQSRTQHPSFALMLQSLTPDEARILRFLAVSGPQPAIDIRSKTPFGVGSERLAGGINMIADMAGCTWPERDQHYLANLNRLGLVRFSAEPVTDFRRYSFVEAQPKAMEAMAKAKKAKTVYRSIYLSLFGKQFCEICFDLEGYDAGGWATDDRGDKIIGKGPPKPKPKHH